MLHNCRPPVFFPATCHLCSEIKRLEQEITQLRNRASQRTYQVHRLEQELAHLQTSIEAIHYENNVWQQRQEGLDLIDSMTARLEDTKEKLAEVEHYHEILKHMLVRLQKDRINNTATLKAFEEALRIHKCERDMQVKILTQATKARLAEELDLQKLSEKQKADRIDIDGSYLERQLLICGSRVLVSFTSRCPISPTLLIHRTCMM